MLIRGLGSFGFSYMKGCEVGEVVDNVVVIKLRYKFFKGRSCDFCFCILIVEVLF